ncbi:hypothetical protein LTR95_000655 [Oleoguttula sp. CCFEE 5521]
MVHRAAHHAASEHRYDATQGVSRPLAGHVYHINALLVARPNNTEVTYKDFTTGTTRAGQGWEKILTLFQISRERGFTWTWIDTCCIDKSSSAELSKAIKSMWKWYEGATECYVLIDDCELTWPLPEVCMTKEFDWAAPKSSRPTAERYQLADGWRSCESPEDVQKIDQFARCRWFIRGWTLQELLAPQSVLFYNDCHYLLGDKSSIAPLVSHAAGISASSLDNYEYQLPKPSVARRMSWAARCVTTREEDKAYCLFGLFDVNMPLLYGEGANAFRRLQEEIIRKFDDLSILAWGFPGLDQPMSEDSPDDERMRHARCVLANGPSDFLGSENILSIVSRESELSRYSVINRGLEVTTHNEMVKMAKG